MWLMEAGILLVVWMEYNYDRDKDLAKRQRRTKTTKTTRTGSDGAVTVEEHIEQIDSKIQDENKS